MAKRRSRIDVIFDILKAIQEKGGSIKPTHLLYKSNLSHNRLKGYVDELSQKQLLTYIELEGKGSYILTEQGYDFLKNYRQLREFTNAFGL